MIFYYEIAKLLYIRSAAALCLFDPTEKENVTNRKLLVFKIFFIL